MSTQDPQNRPKLRLSTIETYLRKNRVIVPPPSRSSLIGMCEDGTLKTSTAEPTRYGWLVYEDSFHSWLQSLDAASSQN